MNVQMARSKIKAESVASGPATPRPRGFRASRERIGMKHSWFGQVIADSTGSVQPGSVQLRCQVGVAEPQVLAAQAGLPKMVGRSGLDR